MRHETAMNSQRARLYRAVREQGGLSAGDVLEESRKLDALVLRYYLVQSAAAASEEVPAEDASEASESSTVPR